MRRAQIPAAIPAAALLAMALAGCGQGDPPAAPQRAATRLPAVPPPRPVPAAPVAAPVPASPGVRLLELVADARVPDTDRRALDAVDAREKAAHPGGYARSLREVEGALRRYRRTGSADRARWRHRLRAALHFGRARATDQSAFRVLDRIDPVLLEDRPRRELVTHADLRAMAASNRYVAGLAGVAPPSEALVPAELAEARRQYARSAAVRAVLTRAGERHAAMVSVWEGLDRAERTRLLSALRRDVRTPEAAQVQARGLETAALTRQARDARASGNAAALADFNRWMRGRWQAQMGMARMENRRLAEDAADRRFMR